jgi:hypothetical protein
MEGGLQVQHEWKCWHAVAPAPNSSCRAQHSCRAICSTCGGFPNPQHPLTRAKAEATATLPPLREKVSAAAWAVVRAASWALVAVAEARDAANAWVRVPLACWGLRFSRSMA